MGACETVRCTGRAGAGGVPTVKCATQEYRPVYVCVPRTNAATFHVYAPARSVRLLQVADVMAGERPVIRTS